MATSGSWTDSQGRVCHQSAMSAKPPLPASTIPIPNLLQEKVVYDLIDPTAVEAEGYRAIYS